MQRQIPTKEITSNYTVTDADCGCRLLCSATSDITITMHSPTGRFNFNLQIHNISAYNVTCMGSTIASNVIATVSCNGTAWYVSVGGGSSSTLYTVTIPTTWSGHGPYSQAVDVEGLTEGTPKIGIMYHGTTSEKILQKEAWNMIDDIDVENGGIVLTCFESKPTTEIVIQIGG